MQTKSSLRDRFEYHPKEVEEEEEEEVNEEEGGR